MSVVTQHQPRSILITMATRYNMEPAAFEATVRATCMPAGNGPQPTREEFAAFLLVAHEHNLNPVTKEIYAYPRRGGGIQPIVSVDGWIKKINEHPQYDGMETEARNDGAGKLDAYTCTIWRKDRSRPTVVTEYLSECIRSTDPWKMQHRMLRHKAIIQCSRIAFGFSGIMDPDEAEKIIDVTPNGPAANAPARPQRADFQGGKLPDERIPIFDHAGDEIGVFRPGRAAAMISGMVTGKDPVTIVAVFERNRETIAALSQLKIEVGDIVAAYDAAVKPSAHDEAEADRLARHFAETGQHPVDDTGDQEADESGGGERNLLDKEPDQREATAPATQERPEFWSRESYAIEIPKTKNGADHLPNWDSQMRQAMADAMTRDELVKLDVDNGRNWQIYQVKLADNAKALRAAFSARAAELAS